MFKVVISVFLITIYASSCYSGCVTPNMPGGISRADVSDPDVIAAADFAVNFYFYPFVNQNYRLISAKQQVVAGIKYFLTVDLDGVECEIQIVYKPWLNQYSSASTTCPAYPIVNGREGVDVYDSEVTSIADFAIQRIYGTLKDYVLVSAQQQVVAGIKYYLNFKIIDSGEECSVEVVVRSWLNEQDILSNTCNNGKIATTTPSTDYST